MKNYLWLFMTIPALAVHSQTYPGAAAPTRGGVSQSDVARFLAHPRTRPRCTRNWAETKAILSRITHF